MPDDPYWRTADSYDRVLERRLHSVRLLGLCMSAPRPGMSILDVGCGTGAYLALYRGAGCRLYGLDASPAMLAVARARLGQGADLRLGDAACMPYGDGAFDLVLCMLALHEMDGAERPRVLSEMQRVLKPGGRILLIDYHSGPPRPVVGWFIRLAIVVTERGAGGPHAQGYRHFMANGGLPALIAAAGLPLQRQELALDGNLALCLLRATH